MGCLPHAAPAVSPTRTSFAFCLSSNSTQPSVKFLPLLPPFSLRVLRSAGSAAVGSGKWQQQQHYAFNDVDGWDAAGQAAGGGDAESTFGSQVQPSNLRVLLQHLSQLLRLLQAAGQGQGA